MGAKVIDFKTQEVKQSKSRDLEILLIEIKSLDRYERERILYEINKQHDVRECYWEMKSVRLDIVPKPIEHVTFYRHLEMDITISVSSKEYESTRVQEDFDMMRMIVLLVLIFGGTLFCIIGTNRAIYMCEQDPLECPRVPYHMQHMQHFEPKK